MRGNIDKVLERDAKLGDLEDKSDNLMANSNRFNSTSRKLRNAMWWQEKKVRPATPPPFLAVVHSARVVVAGGLSRQRGGGTTGRAPLDSLLFLLVPPSPPPPPAPSFAARGPSGTDHRPLACRPAPLRPPQWCLCLWGVFIVVLIIILAAAGVFKS